MDMRSRPFVSALAALGLTTFVGCGSVADGGAADATPTPSVDALDASDTSSLADTPPDSASSAETESACRANATVICPAWHACDPMSFEDVYGTDETCITSRTEHCVDAAGWPGIRDYAGQLRACNEALAADTRFSCSSFYRYHYGGSPVCPFTGALAKDEVCASSWQCASGHCAYQPTGCGKCVDPLAVGDSCVELTSICADGSSCARGYAGKTTCATYVDEGADCTRKPCHWEQSCVSGKCVARPKVGGACSDELSCLPSLACSPTTSTCTARTPAVPGAACGFDSGASTLRNCQHGYRCIAADSTATSGTCAIAKKLAEACTNGPLEDACEADLRCIAGKCAPFGASSCK